MMKQPELGKRIVELRKSKGLTQEELVEKCNLNVRTLQRIESVRYKFTEKKAIGVSVSDTIAVEKGKWSAILNSGEVIGGKYLSEWRFTNKKWLIVSESSGLSFVQ